MVKRSNLFRWIRQRPAPLPSLAPVLANAIDDNDGASAADIAVDTNTVGGELFYYTSLSETKPGVADLKAGTGAVAADSLVPVSAGTQTASLSGLASGTTHFTHWVHTKDGLDSDIITSAGFTTTPFEINSVRGANTKATHGGSTVNLGSLLTPAVTATESSLTLASGRSGDFTLPINGTHPVPTTQGAGNVLNGGPYVFEGTITVDGSPISLQLTIDIENSITVPATWCNLRRTIIPELVLTKVATVCTQAELQTYNTAAALDDLALTVARGCTRFSVQNSNRAPNVSKRALVTSEDRSGIDAYTVTSGLFYSTQARWTYWKLKAQGTGSATFLGRAQSATDCDLRECHFSALPGTAGASWPIGFQENNSTNTRILDCSFSQLIKGIDIRNSLAGLVVQRPRLYEVGADVVFIGGTSGNTTYNALIEDVLSGKLTYINQSTHPDAGQFALGCIVDGLTVRNWRHRLFDGTSPAQGPVYGSGGTPKPILRGVIAIHGLGFSDLYANGAMSMQSMDNTGLTSFDVYGIENARAINADHGSSGGGVFANRSGAQGVVSYTDAGVYNSGTECVKPSMQFSASVPPTLTLHSGYNQGQTPAAGALVNITDHGVYWQNVSNTSTPPNYASPSSIIAGLAALFDDPYRVVDWADYATLEEKEAVYNEMYAPLEGGPLDRGDGIVDHYLCVRRGSAAAKWNHHGVATLSVNATAGAGPNNITATLSACVDIDTICDVYVNGVDGSVAVTIPAGSTAATGTKTLTAGQTVLLKNDIGLLNPSDVA